MKRSPVNIAFSDLVSVCDYFFERRSSKGTSHRTYKTPWRGDPRVNIQNAKGKAKAYQVSQVLKAVQKLQSEQERR
ncbi:toxin HicA [Corynebacterium tuberculostearicum]|nr:toxin HicA [Corynebacterium tuberculostearicum]